MTQANGVDEVKVMMQGRREGKTFLSLALRRIARAERALTNAGFQDLGGQEWKPPLGNELALKEDAARWKSEYEGACRLVAAMHAAAVGEVTGPKRGVVEDVTDIRAELDHMRRLLAMRVGGPLLYTDDGELQDNNTYPFIDFKRDSVEKITRSLMKRTEAEAEQVKPPVVSRKVFEAWFAKTDMADGVGDSAHEIKDGVYVWAWKQGQWEAWLAVCNYLHAKISKMRRRIEPISGQRFSYVELDEVLALVEQLGAP